MRDKLEQFLIELAELSNKYHLYIGGCGCCGSPFIYDDNGEYVIRDLEFDSKTQKYEHDDA